jgi:hypothetical protein
MPLRDHFRPPVSKKASWEGFHGMWPATIIQQLRKQLPPGYVAEPRVHLGTLIEINVGALESHEAAPVVSVETDPPDEYEYEVRIFDVERERALVAAIEFVSPANKDRPESRQAFVAKCAALLRKGVAVSLLSWPLYLQQQAREEAIKLEIEARNQRRLQTLAKRKQTEDRQETQ